MFRRRLLQIYEKMAFGVSLGKLLVNQGASMSFLSFDIHEVINNDKR